ncbi:MAG: DUF4385 domain-containing protein [Gammaproteobacteria bacterium]|nr:DUF4385 domain-containing protein [Gammaproteobacteria bacterium]
MKKLPSYLTFNKKIYPWKSTIDYRIHPHAYRVGKGEQGVLLCEPYKSEIGPHWRFKTPEIALKSSKKILALFRAYLKKKEFVGADMARKYLQMGYTRARRYANYAGGVKYNKKKNYKLLKKGTGDPLKIESAQIFYTAWQVAEQTALYKKMKREWRHQFG